MDHEVLMLAALHNFLTRPYNPIDGELVVSLHAPADPLRQTRPWTGT